MVILPATTYWPTLGDVLNENFKDSMVVRFGGEEFSVLIPNCSNREAHERADNFRRKVENMKPQDIPITSQYWSRLSAGASRRRPQPPACPR